MALGRPPPTGGFTGGSSAGGSSLPGGGASIGGSLFSGGSMNENPFVSDKIGTVQRFTQILTFLGF